MKLLSTVLPLLLLASAISAQQQQLYNQIFTDSMMGKVLAPPVGLPLPTTYTILSRTDTWQLRRFYFKPPGPGQYPEGMNPYSYNDSLVAKLIAKDEWNMLAHKALVQQPAKIKRPPSDAVLVDSTHTPEGGIFFSITKPVFYKTWGLIDMTYYQRDEGRTLPAQCYQGQALFVFIKQSKHKWELIRVVNRFIL
jgi:hypothetical protein